MESSSQNLEAALEARFKELEAGVPWEGQTTKTVPRTTKIIELLLNSMGIQEYESDVIPQLTEFLHRYLCDVLEEAQVYADHAVHKKIELSDVQLAVQSQVDFSFFQPPPRQFLLDLAASKNSEPLPVPTKKVAVRLPPEAQCLTAPCYQVRPPLSSALVVEPIKRKRQREAHPSQQQSEPAGPSFSLSTPKAHPSLLASAAPPPLSLETNPPQISGLMPPPTLNISAGSVSSSTRPPPLAVPSLAQAQPSSSVPSLTLPQQQPPQQTSLQLPVSQDSSQAPPLMFPTPPSSS